ncbi:MAG: 5-deoxy-glucuronate isomerase [Chloroflexi bacterium]|nr:5-deoxy-glucuronate isomerase [Chloroflexota bacterium]
MLIHPQSRSGEYMRVTPAKAGWDLLHFAARRMRRGERWSNNTDESEYALVILGGVCSLRSSRGEWLRIGRRLDVFQGMPYTLYLPRRTEFTVEVHSDELDVAYGWCATNQDHPSRLVRPEQVEVEIRGGGNATRQINHIIPPGFDCHRLVCVEVYTPSGNWSSYPPHKHDVHREDETGNLLEADLEEIYFYKMDRASGYAIQRLYTNDRRLDEIFMARNDNLVLVPEGYHPVVSAHGYTTYYLNFLAGSAQSLAYSDDPEHAWIKKTWRERDPRVPVVSMAMEAE